MPTCWIVAGPNGAGKTTFALQYLPDIANCTDFVNADAIAAGLSPLSPSDALFDASRLFLKEISQRIESRKDFAFETTLSGRGYIKTIKAMQAAGWRVQLIYLALLDKNMSKLRVAERVSHGGHNIPIADVERRFSKSLHNLFEVFSPLVDQCDCLLNMDTFPTQVFEQTGLSRHVYDDKVFSKLLELANG